MNLISSVQQLPSEDIETIQGYVEMIEEENEILTKKISNALKKIEEYNLGKYDYSIPSIGIIELKEILRMDNECGNKLKDLINGIIKQINSIKKGESIND